MSIKKSKITAKGIIEDAKNNIKGIPPPPHKEILGRLLHEVKRIDFNKIAGIDDDQPVPQWKQAVITVDEILELAQLHKWGICKNNDFTYLYNGAYWYYLDSKVLMSFLGDSARKMSVQKLLSRFFGFRKKLLEQFNTVANMPAPENDSDNSFINLLNGTLEIGPKKSKLRSFNMNDFLTYQLPFEYNPLAEAPIFMVFLNKVLPNKDLQYILAEYIGYLFIPNKRLKMEKTLLLYGIGANGKSVVFDTVNALLGRENVSTYSLANLTNENGYYRAMIGNKLLNYASEINRKLDTSFFKQLVSGEPIEARLPYGKPFILENYAKLIFNTNELPVDVEHTNAFFRRFIIIPFEEVIPEHAQDKNLAQKIIESELPGVLNWVLKGLKRINKNEAFTHSEIVVNQVRKYKQDADTTYLFIEEHGYIPDEESYRTLKDIYTTYKSFCYENNYRPLSNRVFKKRLENHNFKAKKTRVGQVIYCIIDRDAYIN